MMEKQEEEWITVGEQLPHVCIGFLYSTSSGQNVRKSHLYHNPGLKVLASLLITFLVIRKNFHVLFSVKYGKGVFIHFLGS